ncbi:hypothetical protein GF339_11075, partial [candidate division KSB3 bacterium]|nr:hypothetical protein [candidate division KSB3 bacterium]MBD3325118.1 hypothetical protein [candidate division KSB3 bacterium]
MRNGVVSWAKCRGIISLVSLVFTLICVSGTAMLPETFAADQSATTPQLQGKIVFQSDRDGDWEIFAMNADQTNLVQLTHNRLADEYPVWSPDGTQIAFKSARDGNYELYVMQADGTAQRQVTNHPAQDEDPAWSPDGRTLLFHSDRSGTQQLYTINLDGSRLQQLTETAGRNALAVWNPQEERIAFTGKRAHLGWGIYVMQVDGTEMHRLTGNIGACRPDWSPDGRQIAYVSEQDSQKTDIWIMNPDGSEKRKLTRDEANYDYYPAWSPDGTSLVYAKTSDKTQGNWELYAIAADGTGQVRFTID